MSQTPSRDAPSRGRARIRSDEESALRRAYFAQAGEAAARYGVGFGDVLEHLMQASDGRRRSFYRSILHMDDLVHAVACARGVSRAWSDLIDRYERMLVRQCRLQQTGTESIVFVRRLLNDLRRPRAEADGIKGGAPTLRQYQGTRPLRTWLTTLVVSQVARSATGQGRHSAGGAAPSGSTGSPHAAAPRVQHPATPPVLRFSEAAASEPPRDLDGPGLGVNQTGQFADPPCGRAD